MNDVVKMAGGELPFCPIGASPPIDRLFVAPANRRTDYVQRNYVLILCQNFNASGFMIMRFRLHLVLSLH